jgi:hypothetical protein
MIFIVNSYSTKTEIIFWERLPDNFSVYYAIVLCDCFEWEREVAKEPSDFSRRKRM